MEDIKLDLKEIGWEGKERIHMAANKRLWRGLVNQVLYLQTANTVELGYNVMTGTQYSVSL
jgi:hypothetical protein